MNIYFIIASLLSVFLVLCLARLFLGWFQSSYPPRLQWLFTITRFWLHPFSKIKLLRLRQIDLTPLVAIIVLQAIIQLFWKLSLISQFPGLTVTVGWLLFVIISLIASAINFLLLFFVVIALIRIIGIFVQSSNVHRFWLTLDHILQPLIYPIISRISPHRIIPYGTALTLYACLVGLTDILLQLALNFLANQVISLGF